MFKKYRINRLERQIEKLELELEVRQNILHTDFGGTQSRLWSRYVRLSILTGSSWAVTSRTAYKLQVKRRGWVCSEKHDLTGCDLNGDPVIDEGWGAESERRERQADQWANKFTAK